MARTLQLTALFVLLRCLLFGALLGQEFEVASVKPAPPPGSPQRFRGIGMFGGPGSDDPTRMRFRNFSLKGLVNVAYGVDFDQIQGPAWTEELQYEIIATLPKETTTEQSRLMLQKLLSERFHLEFHRETKQIPVFTLIAGKSGSKLAPTKPVAEAGDGASPANSGPVKKDKDGYPILRDGMQMAITSHEGHSMARMQGKDQDISYLTRMLSGQLRAPVYDATGLTGKYDFVMSWVPQPPGVMSPEKEEFGPTIFSALEEQLGLKLVSKKGPVELIVIDRADKTPTEN